MFLTLLRSIPLLTACLVMIYSYWCYVYMFCDKALDEEDLKLANFLFYHLALFMMSWCYYKVAMTPPALIPKEFYLSASTVKKIWLAHGDTDEIEEILQRKKETLPIRTYAPGKRIRYCKECKIIKPDRTHHCRTCGSCIPKMDHHCPWMNNCVSFSNYKFFVQFLAYGVMYCFYIAVTMLYTVVQFWLDFLTEGITVDESIRYHCTALFLAACFFFLAFTILLMYHIYLIAHNRTTLEAYRAPLFINGQDKYGFDLGIRKNFQQVFGTEKALWMFPIFSSLGQSCSYSTGKDTDIEWGADESSES